MNTRRILPALLCLAPISAVAATTTPWWEQPTICQLNPTKCYTSMGVGFDAGLWDATSNCWGMKLICAEALSTIGDPVPKSKTQLAAGTGINSDFDINAFSMDGSCYGARKVSSSGSTATVNGNQVKVYCPGVLSDAGINDKYIQSVANGEISTGPQPNCTQLASNGWVAVLNGNCYGKKYDLNDYYIDCNCSLCAPPSTSDLPNRIINIRAASGSFISGTGIPATTASPATQAAANTIFDTMASTSAARKASKFNQ